MALSESSKIQDTFDLAPEDELFQSFVVYMMLEGEA